MPIVPSSYKARGVFKNGHFSTIYSAKLRPTPALVQERERVILPDNDFLDIDWSFSKQTSHQLAILLHGLEGNAQRTYIKGQGKYLTENGWDVAAVNYRGCSGELNQQYHSYNAGKTDDLETVVEFIRQKDKYKSISLIGFSLGGNLLLKYLGERHSIPKEITKGIAISSPLSLKGSLSRLEEWHNWIYRTTFLNGLRSKYKLKMAQHPDHTSQADLERMRSLFEFDDIYTAKAHGFVDAFDYYKKSSCLQFLPLISQPVLILNAQNDTFLSTDCYPTTLASESKNIYLETPKHGGHVGFHESNQTYYNESRAFEFLTTKF